MSRRSRLHYHLATIGYWASRMMARSPRPEGLPGDSLSFGAAVRYELPSHTTSRQNRHTDLSRRDDSCNCFSLMVTSDRSHKGLSPSITAPCPAHNLVASLLGPAYTFFIRLLSNDVMDRVTVQRDGHLRAHVVANEHVRVQTEQLVNRRNVVC
jgi:hypothetical protein